MLTEELFGAVKVSSQRLLRTDSIFDSRASDQSVPFLP